ncbi:MAG: four helix bundle protein [Bacteroidaceae bacterium]|nr:four helix bundle protein [Bacteroidaceae bacterium]
MENFYYRRLEVYQYAKALSHEVCKLIKTFPVDERFALCDQLRRAVMSIPINIAEGFGRFSAKEKAHFIQIAFGSINEVMCELELAFDEGYINQEQLNDMESRIISVKKQLANLHKSVLANGDKPYSLIPNP